MVDKAAWRVRRHRERWSQAAEQLYGPYRWGRYDLLVLPPSFPFGGMENPRLTFATPTDPRRRPKPGVAWWRTSWRTPGRATSSPTRPGATSGSTRASPSTSRTASWRRSTAARRARWSVLLAQRDLREELAEPPDEPGDTLLAPRPDRPRPRRRHHATIAYEKGAALPARAREALRPRDVRRLPARLLRRATPSRA